MYQGQIVKKEQFTKLYRDYRHLVWSTARSVLQDSNSAEDITQEVFLRLEKLEELEHPAAWLKRVAKRLSLNYARDTKRRIHLIDVNKDYISPFMPPDVIELLAAEDFRLQCNREIDQLPDEFQAVAYRLLDGQKPHEIQKTMNLSAGTVSSRVYRIRLRLSKLKKD